MTKTQFVTCETLFLDNENTVCDMRDTFLNDENAVCDMRETFFLEDENTVVLVREPIVHACVQGVKELNAMQCEPNQLLN